MGYALLGILISAIWLITGWQYFREEKNGTTLFLIRVALLGIPMLLISILAMLNFS